MTFTQGHALLFGVGSYLNAPGMNVPIVKADAREVAQVLQDAAICGYPSEQVRLITDEKATKKGILAALDALAARTGVEDTVFLYYCGHGGLGTDGEYYLVSHDARGTGDRVLAGTGVSESELLARLKAIQAGRVLMVFNTCFSGSISPALGVERAEFASQSLAPDTSAALLGTGAGRIIITACRENQKSYIGPGKLTIFTQALVDGLRGRGVRNNAGFISAYSLYEYVFEQVSQVVSQQNQLSQEPELTVLKGVGPFAVALYKGASDLGAFSPEDTPPETPAVQQVPEAYAQKVLSYRNVHTGGGAYIEGSVNTGGGDFVGRDKITKASRGGVAIGGHVSGSTIVTGDGNVIGSQVSPQKFYLEQIFKAIEARSDLDSADKADIIADVMEIQKEDAKGGDADESFIARRLRNIQRIAPEILEVVLGTIANPAAGFGAAAQTAARKLQ